MTFDATAHAIPAVGVVLLILFLAFIWLEHQRAKIKADAARAAAAKAAAKREAAEPDYCQP